MKITAIFGGGDWNDASVEHLILPEGMVVAEQYALYNEWVKTLPPWPGRYNLYKTFPEWLISKGAMQAPEEYIEEFWE